MAYETTLSNRPKKDAHYKRVYKKMEDSWASMKLLAGGVPIRLGAGPRDREACLHYFTEGSSMLVYAWLDGAAWGVQPVIYHVQGTAITGPSSPLPRKRNCKA